MFASEYGWTKDYIYFSVYPEDLFLLKDEIEVRHALDALDKITYSSFPHMAEEDQRTFRDELITGIKVMRGTYFEETIDRTGVQKLKEAMNVKGSKMKVK